MPFVTSASWSCVESMLKETPWSGSDFELGSISFFSVNMFDVSSTRQPAKTKMLENVTLCRCLACLHIVADTDILLNIDGLQISHITFQAGMMMTLQIVAIQIKYFFT